MYFKEAHWSQEEDSGRIFPEAPLDFIRQAQKKGAMNGRMSRKNALSGSPGTAPRWEGAPD